MPINYKRDYPADWHAVSKQIRNERAEGKCEQCAAPNGQLICRFIADPVRWQLEEDIRQSDGRWMPPIKVVLTVAHTCECRPLCSVPDHLLALCQRCHLRMDSAQHKRNAAATRRAKKFKDQPELFPAIENETR